MLIFLYATDKSSALPSWIPLNNCSATKTWEYHTSSTQDLYSLGQEMRPSWPHCISQPNGLDSIHSFVTTRQAHNEVMFLFPVARFSHRWPPGLSLWMTNSTSCKKVICAYEPQIPY
jgi:hypothetical protein